ncbi:MAG: DUF3850 domain-containing protein [Ruminococcus sp.]|nr:DUF3850 domain-containing protein [Ruminococcus sp.]
MGRTHKLKLHINFCDDVLNGIKTFEIRENDRGFQTGDLILFEPFYPHGATFEQIRNPHPIKEKMYRIEYILNGWGMKNGYVCLAIKEYRKNENN